MSDAPQPSVPPASESGAAPIPPVPVAGTPAPKYGEFAPVEQSPAAPVPPASPGAASAVPIAPSAYPQAGYPQAAQPQQGHPQQGYPQAPYPQQSYPQAGPVYGQPGFGQTPVRKRRTWDVVLTIILLVLGLGGMAIAVFYGAFLPLVFDQMYGQYGLGGYTDDGSLSIPATVIVVSHVLLYLLAAAVSILLLVKRKIAFWVPLTAGPIAAVVFWATLMTAVFNDPNISRVLGI